MFSDGARRDGPRAIGPRRPGAEERRPAAAWRRGTLVEQRSAAAETCAAAEAVRRSLLPPPLPQIDGLELAGHYLPAEGELGGDWYDVFALPGGRAGFAMGDVVGYGVHSAVVMGRLRAALRACALEHDDPAEVLRRLDGFIRHFEPGAMATLIYGVGRAPFERLRVSCAGHLPPVIASPAGAGALVELPPDLPIGVDAGAARRTTALELPPGALLLLYTDGLVERRPLPGGPGLPLDEALARLPGAITAESAQRAIAGALHHQLGAGEPEDDVAILALRRVPVAAAPPPGAAGG
ncbi:MAG: serine/threonine-protein phosphatase [Frankiaceae bacterium]|jgi:serine phosphatase RsbU (regulator of sigma subunit)|nr:serine/threonine-protein phosphatase [Frankiaceae bacterium]